MERWNGKVAVVTGASAGIGLSTVKQLLQHGLIVVGLARRVDKMKDEMKDVKGPGQFHAKECDVTSEQSVNEAFGWIKSTFKTVHILVNNAGVIKLNTIGDSSTEDLETTFKVNVFGLLYCTKQAIKMMKENQTEGHIINVNSGLGHKVNPNFTQSNVYPATKFAVRALSESLTHELADSKIRTTSVSPGPVETDMFGSLRANVGFLEKVPALKPEDVASSIVHALSAPPHVEINEIILRPKKL